MTRLESNRDILNLLEYLIEKYPDQRFSQILQNFGLIKPNRPANPENRIDWQNEFYMEPDELLKRIKQRIEDMEK